MGQVIYYKVGQSLLQSEVGIIEWDNFMVKWGNYYYRQLYTYLVKYVVNI